ncbi:2-C-methyl-D-erythritol 4-phosphate cytidylyltransferase [Brackiella oedipodis]|uniref:2-C-methyl-D-erythritol 4-phosphate cytidylyltransferase n=1 Tax=Brackiella oedipodis TaxID=124225 RepID=UPI00048EA95E|nr:2-C-methyl-D-erythritol 4-phosphate cytidylyltransferase [Brackiella oedipodis]
MRIVAILPAAGVGQRAAQSAQQKPKQYTEINGKTMLQHSTLALLQDPRLERVYISVAAQDPYIEDYVWPEQVQILKQGGVTRAHTVLQSLAHLLSQQLLDPHDWVLVHDAARPALKAQALGRLIDHCLAAHQGGILALPIADTVKRAKCAESSPAQIASTLDRRQLWLAQTPQMFPAQALHDALAQGLAQGANITDEASAIEQQGAEVLLIKGHWENLKVTWPEDFALVAHFLD